MLIAAGPEDGVKEAGAGWRQGAIKQDKALLEKYLADDMVYTHGGGQAETKAQYIANVTKGPSHYQSMTERDSECASTARPRCCGGSWTYACERRALSRANAGGLHAERQRCVADGSEGISARADEIEIRIGRLEDW